MDQSMMEVLLSFKQRYHNEPQDLKAYIAKIQEWVTDSVWNRNFEVAEEVKNRLGLALCQERPEHLQSYVLGQVQAIVDMVRLFSISHEEDAEIKGLTEPEREILELIGQEGEANPTEIAELCGRTKQHVSNLLRQLLDKELVTVFPVGKNRWYSLSSLGFRVHARLREREGDLRLQQAQQEELLARQRAEIEQSVRAQYEQRQLELIGQHEKQLRELTETLKCEREQRETMEREIQQQRAARREQARRQAAAYSGFHGSPGSIFRPETVQTAWGIEPVLITGVDHAFRLGHGMEMIGPELIHNSTHKFGVENDEGRARRPRILAGY